MFSVLKMQYITLLLLSCGGLIRFVEVSCSPLHALPVSHCSKVMREISCRPCYDQRKRNAMYKSIIRNKNYQNRAQHAMNLDASFGPSKTHTTEGQYSNRIWHKYEGRLWTWMFCLSQYLTNLMHKICFTISFISCLYMFRARVLIIRRSRVWWYQRMCNAILTSWWWAHVLETCRGMK